MPLWMRFACSSAISARPRCPSSIIASTSWSQRPAGNRDLIGSLLGPGGDPAFIKRLIDLARDEISGRMQTGIFPAALGSFFDYYLSYVVTAEVGVVQRWFENGLPESPKTMARIMTVIAFVRPGDLYGQPIDINVPAYGMKLLNLQLDDTDERNERE